MLIIGDLGLGKYTAGIRYIQGNNVVCLCISLVNIRDLERCQIDMHTVWASPRDSIESEFLSVCSVGVGCDFLEWVGTIKVGIFQLKDYSLGVPFHKLREVYIQRIQKGPPIYGRVGVRTVNIPPSHQIRDDHRCSKFLLPVDGMDKAKQ